MNKQLYKVIFNQERGQMMVVPENATAQRQSSTGTPLKNPVAEPVDFSFVSGCLKPLTFFLMLMFGTAFISERAEAANIQADKNSPKNEQPIVLQTANGLPQVNIQTPTSAGVSVNQYQQFDVNSKGAILNNSRRNTQTQLGGWIQGNPFLATGEARVIVNQVNSANPSLLNGYVEVGGKRAEVILANPAGIQVNGGGFINAQSATLTTGQTLIGGGQLDRYAVHDGKISIKGKGLDAKDTDFTRILSRYVEVDAPIAANDLTVIAGQNTVSADGKIQAATKNTPKQKTVAIDSSELGGMYANKITLISTENNQRIDNKGQIFAQAGGVALDSQGYLTNAGTISSQGKTEIKAGDVRNSGTISSKDKFDFKAENLDNSGTVLAANEWNARLSGSLKQGKSGNIEAARLDVEAVKLDNAGTISQTGLQGLAIESTGAFANGGKIGYPEADNSLATGNSVGANGTSVPTQNAPSSVTGLGSVTTVSGLSVAQTFATGSLRTKQALNNSGSLNANGGVDLTAKSGLNNTAELTVNKLAVLGDVLNNANAKITAQTTDIHTNTVDNRQGEFTATQQLNITANQLDNRSGKLQSVNDADLAISGSLNNQDGEIAANHALNIHDNQAKTLRIDNTDGKIVAKDVSLQSQSLDNRGKLAAGNNLSIDLKDDFSVERNLEAGNKLSIKTAGSLNNAQTIQAESEVNIRAKQDISNRGLMSSNGLTRVEAGQELLNIGTGKIYGDHVALAADSVVNRDENGKAAVVAARERLDIGARKLENQEAAVLSSEGDLGIGGSLNAEHKATGLADSLINGSARIEAQGNGSIAVRDLRNLNNHFKTEEYLANSRHVVAYGYANSTTRYIDGVDGREDKHRTNFHFHLNDGTTAISIHGKQTKTVVREEYDELTYKEKIVEGSNRPASIVLGGSLNIHGDKWLNENSHIIVGENIVGNNNQLIENKESLGNQRIEKHDAKAELNSYNRGGKAHTGKRRIRFDVATGFDAAPKLSTYHFADDIVVFKQNTAIGANQQTADKLPHASITTGNIKTLNNNTITLPTNSLYTINPNHSGPLVETDPVFVNYRQWLGSDYMLAALKTDPNNMHKRLGDGYYEQKLVNEQINRLTGFRRLDGYRNDEEQFKALMQSGVTAAQELGLTLGIALSAEQVSRLTSDIVWLETQTVTLPDGSTQTVWVPKVYVVARKGDLTKSGSLIGAEQIHLNISNGTLQNGGTIGARQIVAINAKDIEHSGHLQAEKIGLQATDNIDFNGGTAVSGSLFQANANNINLNSTTSTSGDKRNGNTVFDRVAAVYVQGDAQGNGTLSLHAKNDVNLSGAQLSNAGKHGATRIIAQNNLNVSTVRTENHETYGELSDKNHRHVHQTAEIGSQIQTQGNVVLASGNDINIRQGDINSVNGTVALSAKNNVSIEEGRQTLAMDVSVHSKSRGVLSSTKTLDQFQLNHDEAVGSTITGKQVSVSAGKNVAIRGSNVVSDEGVQIVGAENVYLTAAQNHYRDGEFHETKKSGLMSSGGIGFAIGSKKTTDETDSTSLTHTSSTVGSLNGDTYISVGKQYTQHGSTVSSLQGNNYISAQNIDVTAAENSYTNDHVQTMKQKGLTVAVNVPVVNMVQNAVQMATTAPQVSKNDRVNAMAAANTAWQAYQGLESAKDFLKAPKANAAEVSATITYGEQRNRSENHQTRTEAQSSQVLSGGKTYLIATGAGQDSDINIIGSDVIGKGGTYLSADDQINLQSAIQTARERSSNKSSGWNAGVAASYGQNGMAFGVTAGGNYGKGYGKGDGTTHRHSQLGDRNSQTTLQSGGTTTLKGAQVHGKGIDLSVQDLLIESVQDTATYQSKQQNINGQVTVGYGASVSAGYDQSKINADHASVSQQSGLFAGDDGYRVNVANHTELKGGVIASSQQAENEGKSHFSTGTLTSSDIQNYSRYEGESFGIGTDGNVKGGWIGKAKDGLSASLGYGNDGDSQNSITKSGINTQNIQIKQDSTGELAQSVYTDITSETAQQLSGSLKNNFDANTVQNELDLQRTVSQDFSQTSQQAGTEINRKAKEHNDKAEQLAQAAAKADVGGNQELAQALAAQADDERKKAASWQRGGVLVNMISAGLTAPTQSMTGMVAATASPALSYEIGQQFKKHNAEGTPAHILAHAILGAAVAAAGDNNALAGALSAGGAEAAAPYISKWLYGKDKGSDLTAEEKETVTAITSSLLGTATGAVIGDTTANAAQGSLNAQSAVINNGLIDDWLREKLDNLKQVLKTPDAKTNLDVVRNIAAEAALIPSETANAVFGLTTDNLDAVFYCLGFSPDLCNQFRNVANKTNQKLIDDTVRLIKSSLDKETYVHLLDITEQAAKGNRKAQEAMGIFLVSVADKKPNVRGLKEAALTLKLPFPKTPEQRRYSAGTAYPTAFNELKEIKAGKSWISRQTGEAPFPKQIAEKMYGRHYNNFNQFKADFWKEVAKDPVLSKQFSI